MNLDRFELKIYNDIKARNLLAAGSHVIAGVSGGADSMGLLCVLGALRALLKLEITVCHIHHGIREDSADEDARYVEDFCSEAGYDYRIFKVNVPKLAKEQKLSLEEMGRKCRYEIFAKLKAELGADVICVAHHMDDQAETVLMHLLRGSGITGLSGMSVRSGDIVRPLLGVSRAEIEEYLARKGIAFRVDETNLVPDYTRNMIRLKLMPAIKEDINAKATEHIAAAAAQMAEVDDFLQTEAAKALESISSLQMDGEKVAGMHLDAKGLEGLHPALRKECIYRAICHVAGQKKDIEQTHVMDVLGLLDKQVGKSIMLPYELLAVRTYEGLTIGRAEAVKTADALKPENEIVLSVPGTAALPGGREVTFSLMANNHDHYPESNYTKWFDYDIMKYGLVLRGRRQGDYMTLAGGLKKSLKRILMDDKIPQAERDGLMLLADGSHVLWILDTGRISEIVKVKHATKQILVAEMKEINHD